MGLLLRSSPGTCSPPRNRSARPILENLEGRLLLYSTLGANWVYGSRITYSFVPDGTSVGGTPSALFQTLNARFPTATWQAQFQRAAAVWQAVANINLAQVSDDGTAIGANGNQQGDPRFGDIRFSAIPQSSGTLAVCFLPPPINGGSDAGDIVLNSSQTWQINSGLDLQTVAIHEIGHALGMGHSQIAYACMYATYNGIKQGLTSDDSSGLQSIYGAPRYDPFNSNGLNNGSYSRATNINSYLGANGQVAIPALDITTGSQTEWFYVTVPASTTGTMVAKVQSSNLSSMSPKIDVYTTSLGLLGSANSSAYGATVSVSVGGVQAGQNYLIRAAGYAGGSATGGFGLLVNFGSQAQPPIPPPNTVVLQQPDQGGGSTNRPKSLAETDWTDTTSIHPGRAMGWSRVAIGRLQGWGETLDFSDLGAFPPRPPQSQSNSPADTVILINPGSAADVLGTLRNPSAGSSGAASNASIAATTADPWIAAGSRLVFQALDDAIESWRADDLKSLVGI